MRWPSYTPGTWRGQPDGMLPLSADDWFELLHESQTEREWRVRRAMDALAAESQRLGLYDEPEPRSRR